MHVTPLVAIAAIAAGVAYIINKIYESFRHAAKARELGCQPPVRMGGIDPTGIEGLIYSIIATRKKLFPTWMGERLDDVCEREGRPVRTVNVAVPFLRNMVFTVEPKNIQTILALKFKEFGFGVNRTENFKPLLGNGIFAANGKEWEHSRALLRPQFVRSQVSDIDLEEAHVKSLMSVLDRRTAPNGWTNFVDLQPLFFRLTLDSATEFLFGESVNSQMTEDAENSKGSESSNFAYAFDQSQLQLAMAARLGHNYWMLHTPGFHRHVKNVHTFVDYFVQKALKQGAAEKDLGAEKGKYVFLEALALETRDPEELRSQLLNILLAGRDTTASTLGWFFHTMAQDEYQKYYQRLRTIVLDDFGTYSNPKDISFEALKNCQFLQWCINETLRLYPIVSFNVRTAQQDTSLPTGGGPDGQSPIYIRKGQDVGYSVHVMQRRKDLWGNDADEFRPERWEARKPGWDYLPFNGGPRICIGQQFALTEVAYVLVRMIQRIEQIDGSRVRGNVTHNLTLTNCPGDGVDVRLRLVD